MIRSMTGFGDAETDLTGTRPPLRMRVQVKTVNHRFFNSSVRLPGGLDRWEPAVGALLRSRIQRGHVHFALSVDRAGEGSDAPLPEVDLERAQAYADGLREAARELGLPGEISVTDLVRYSDIFSVQAQDRRWTDSIDEALLTDLTSQALDALVAMREQEGERLAADLRERLNSISELTSVVETRAPVRLLAERDRLQDAIAELLGSTEVDEDRLAREIAYLAEKWDLNEEVVRLRSHVALFTETLSAPSDEAVGKRLGFVLQELNREANTIASKANDAEIARAAVGLKEEIERLREQVENIE